MTTGNRVITIIVIAIVIQIHRRIEIVTQAIHDALTEKLLALPMQQ